MSDNIVIYLLIALVVVLLVARPILRRRARAAGMQRWERQQQRKGGDDGLGLGLVLATDVATALPIVDRVLMSGKRVRRIDTHSWGQQHYKTDDVVYGIQPVDGGALVRVTRAIETGGDLSGVKAWRTLREQITTEAAAAGITTTPSPQPLTPGAEIDGARAWFAPV